MESLVKVFYINQRILILLKNILLLFNYYEKISDRLYEFIKGIN